MSNISFEPWMCSWPDSSKQGQGFPHRFWLKWRSTYAKDPMLHLFCGASDDGMVRIDIREEATGATHFGDFSAAVSFGKVFASAFADPPYTDQHAAEWGHPLPKPSEILRVMRDCVMVGGIIGVLHLQVLRPIKGLGKVAWHPVFCGTTKHLRCLSVFRVNEYE